MLGLLGRALLPLLYETQGKLATSHTSRRPDIYQQCSTDAPGQLIALLPEAWTALHAYELAEHHSGMSMVCLPPEMCVVKTGITLARPAQRSG